MEQQPLANDVDRDLEDALSTLWLVRGNDRLTRRMGDQIVDLLLERILVGMRAELVAGTLTANEFATELAALADQCRAVGLLAPIE